MSDAALVTTAVPVAATGGGAAGTGATSRTTTRGGGGERPGNPVWLRAAMTQRRESAAWRPSVPRSGIRNLRRFGWDIDKDQSTA
jgi:hypothetical protein